MKTLNSRLLLLVFLAQIGTVAILHAQYTIADTAVAARYFETSKALFAKTENDSAYVKAEQARLIYTEVLGKEAKETAFCWEQMGIYKYEAGDYQTSMECYEKALPILLAVFGEKDPELAALYNNKGITLFRQGKFDAALVEYNRALPIRLVQYGEEHRRVANLYKHIGYCEAYLGNFQQAFGHFQKDLKISLKISGEKHERTATAYENLAMCQQYMGDLKGGIQNLQRGLAIEKSIFGEKHPKLAATYSNLGEAFNLQGDYDNALDALSICLDIRQNIPALAEHPDLANTYANLSSVYENLGDYDRSIALSEKALAIRLKAFGENHHSVADCYYDLGSDFAKKGDFEKAVFFHEKALQVAKIVFGENHREVAGASANLANTFFLKGDLEKSAALHHNAITVFEKNDKDPDLGLAYGNLIEVYIKRGDIDAAMQLLEKSEKFNLRVLGASHPELIKTYRNMAICQREIGNMDAAEKLLEKSVQAARYDGHDFRSVSSMSELIATLTEKIELLRSQAQIALSADLTQKTKQVLTFFDAAVRYQATQLTSPGSQSVLYAQSRQGYESAIALCLLLSPSGRLGHFGYEAFTLAEKTKSLFLYQGVQDAKALKFSGIPDSILANEHDLRMTLALLEKQRFDIESKGVVPTDSNLLSMKVRIFDAAQAYDNFKKQLETDFPEYYQLKYALRAESAVSLQRDLLYSDMALLEYFVGDSSIFIFRVGKTDFEVKEVRKDFPLEQWVAQLRTGMTAFHTDPLMANRYDSLSTLYVESAYHIYEKLIAPVAAKLPKKVIVIPDGVLGYVPFEALLAEKPMNAVRWNTHHYFINDHAVSYCYSATMLREMLLRKNKKQPNVNFYGFAPSYDGDTTLLASTFQYADDMRKDLRPLPNSGEEVYRIARMMHGQAFTGNSATKENFVQLAGQAKILHLAMHGQANDQSGDYCFLVFADSSKHNLPDSSSLQHYSPLMYARDIYNLALNADLVTLSACETGIGQLQNGEGIISLARAFTYAGAKSIVTSLWSVSDAKTKELMIDFYKNLRRGALKDDALRQSKLTYLQKNKGQAAHPFFWSGFVGIGNMGPVK